MFAIRMVLVTGYGLLRLNFGKNWHKKAASDGRHLDSVICLGINNDTSAVLIVWWTIKKAVIVYVSIYNKDQTRQDVGAWIRGALLPF